MKSQVFLVLRISYKSVESWFPNPQAVFCLESPCFLSPCSACVIQTSDREISEQAVLCFHALTLQMCCLTVLHYVFGWPQTGSLGWGEDRNGEAV